MNSASSEYQMYCTSQNLFIPGYIVGTVADDTAFDDFNFNSLCIIRFDSSLTDLMNVMYKIPPTPEKNIARQLNTVHMFEN